MPASETDLSAARDAVQAAHDVVLGAARALDKDIDARQVVAYDIAHAAAAIELAQAMLDYGEKGEVEARLACAFVADAVHDLAGKVLGRDEEWATKPGVLSNFRTMNATCSLPALPCPVTAALTSLGVRNATGTPRRAAHVPVPALQDAARESWASVPTEEFASRLRDLTACGHPESPTTSGLVGVPCR